MRDKIKAIPTKYKGVTFRSKMESLFAKWCDQNNQKWIYEPEGLTNGKDCYLPDFLLPDSKLIVEIKPVFFIEETSKMNMLLDDEYFEKFSIAVIEMSPGPYLLKSTEIELNGDSMRDLAELNNCSFKRIWQHDVANLERKNISALGFCPKCNTLNLSDPFYGYMTCGYCGHSGDYTPLHQSRA